jgi:hypothetical protein
VQTGGQMRHHPPLSRSLAAARVAVLSPRQC